MTTAFSMDGFTGVSMVSHLGVAVRMVVGEMGVSIHIREVVVSSPSMPPFFLSSD
jgi:hypothetical protein